MRRYLTTPRPVTAERIGRTLDRVAEIIVERGRHPDPEMTRGAILGLTSQLQRFDLAIAARATREHRP